MWHRRFILVTLIPMITSHYLTETNFIQSIYVHHYQLFTRSIDTFYDQNIRKILVQKIS